MKEGDILVEYVARPGDRTITMREHVVTDMGAQGFMYITHGYMNPIENLISDRQLEACRNGSALSISVIKGDTRDKEAVGALIDGMAVVAVSMLDDARKVYTEICERLSQPITLIDKTKQEGAKN